MRDEQGVYYLPNPQNRRIKMYVRLAANGQIEFRMDNADVPEIWQKHGWMPMQAVKQAAAMYKEKGREANPLAFYDEVVARAVLNEQKDR